MNYTLTNQIEWLPNRGWDERIHIAANGDLVNVFMLVTDYTVVLVDTLLNETTAAALLDHARPYCAMRQLLVINSHSDWDHAWGNQLFAGPTARYPAPIIAHRNAATEYNRPQNVAYLHRMQAERPDIFAGVTLTPPTITFSHDLWIDGGDLNLHLFPTPGHSPDHIAIFIPEISTLLASDAAEIPFPLVYRAADVPILRASLRAMADLAPQNAFYCHAPPETGAQLLRDNIAYYDALEAACRAALAHGIETSDIQAVPHGELPTLLKCEFADVTPTTGAWAEVSPDAATEQHGLQLRLMLAWLTGEDLQINED
jgi:glyoxylase-like metal-dependent hydrolase (beta-lactamase superfamily II)